MANQETSKDRRRATTPPRHPPTTPPDHVSTSNTDLLFRVILEVQKTLGELTSSVKTLTDATKSQAEKIENNTIAVATLGKSVETTAEKTQEHGDKLDEVRLLVWRAKGALWLLAALVGVLLAWLRWFAPMAQRGG